MSEVKEFAIGDLVTFQRGHDLPREEMKEGVYPVAGSNSIIGYHNKFTTEGPGITIGRSGNIGNPQLHKTRFWAHNTTLYVKEFKNIDPVFFYYLLQTLDFTQLNSGSAVPSLNRNFIHPFKVKIPTSKHIQNEIAEILSSLDDKIELNNKINQELETLAQTLFKQWFIDFEFPNEIGETYKSSGGEMVDSELGEIPKGWLIGNFGDLANISSGKGINKKNYQTNGDYPIIGANGIMGNYDRFNIEGFKILTGRVGTLGTVRISNEKAWTSDNVLICEPLKVELGHYSYFVMKDFDYKSLNRGSTQPLLTQTDLKSQTVIIPQTNILLKFQNQMDFFLSTIELNKSELKELKTLRDTLLPKLISGELEINEISN